MIKDLNNKVFKYYIYIEYYDIALYFTRNLRFKTINNFFFKPIFKLIKKIYRKEETKH